MIFDIHRVIHCDEEAHSSKEPLICDEAGETSVPHENWFRKRVSLPVYVYLLCLFAYGVMFGAGILARRPRICVTDLTHSPAAEVVQYKKIAFNGTLTAKNVYKGQPRPELDHAWSRLTRHMNIRLSGEELERLDRDAIELHDRSGYHGVLSVYHHIHCLKYLRHVIYDDYYHVDSDGGSEHIDHCIDDIRQALMCNADISVVTMVWKPNYRRPWPDFRVDHTCVDWDALDEWASRRSFDLFDQKSLVHPQMGLIYPLVDGKYEGLSHGPDIHIVWPNDTSPT